MVLSLTRWAGKVAVITGASSGIGAGIAKQLVENGLVVVGLARRTERVDELAKELSGKTGKLCSVKTDMTKETEILDAFKFIKEKVGPVSILINAAGVHESTNLTDGSTEAWMNTFNVNVIGLCIATREAFKSMKENNIDGHIVHINSIVGHKVVHGLNVLPASKWAVTALTETLRLELNSLGSKVKITSISPGVTDTEFLPEELRNAEVFNNKLSSEDVADAVTYVLSTPPHVQVHELTIKPVNEAI